MNVSLPVLFNRGIDSETNPRKLENGFVSDASNFLFDSQRVTTRPGTTSTTLTITPEWLKSFSLDGTVYHIAYTSAGLERLSSSFAATNIGSYTFLRAGEYSVDVVNGVFIIGNITNGVVLHTPPSTTTQVSAAPYCYVTGMGSRAIGARHAAASRMVGWSVAGDATDWVGAGSGSVYLSDATDEITALGVIKNILIVGRRSGFHFGYLTGVNSPVFRFENVVRHGDGVNYPNTWVVEGAEAFYVGRKDIYRFTPKGSVAIGYPIREEIFRSISQGINYTGSVINALNRRRYYQLTPTNAPTPATPVYMFDTEDKVWSKHHYGMVTTTGAQIYNDIECTTVGVLAGTALYRWVLDSKVEKEAVLRTGLYSVGDGASTISFEKAFLSYKGEWGGTPQLEVQTMHPVTRETVKIVQEMGDSRDDWVGEWFKQRTKGLNLRFVLRVPLNSRIELDQLDIKAGKDGEYRGRV